ncbi:hypothetical protein G7077_08640 [Sphingomonas piscis]|uniref:Uncharacterized protein n=1 Tax=Sphingomonas piscis TaxID=2714943 RepID=A0A6G7YQD6_9SPHN|nr:hypothetical protein [Sphingomonas piscis]QIK78952.1 hypothetical protein G7077_08640 [Sphingomonas piscis]
MQMSFAAHAGFDPPLDLMLHGQHNGIPPMLACFDFKPAHAVPEGRDCVVIVGTRNHRAIKREIATRARKAVVITCHGDKTFTNDGRPIPDNVVRVFTTNREHSDPRVISIPLGVKSAMLQMLKFARRHRPQGSLNDRALLYLNFATGDEYDLPAAQRGVPHRKEIAERFRGEEWVTDRVFTRPTHDDGALFKYLTEVMRHKFVASPEGFGIDCHRHWESLYLGAIPIVQRSRHMQAFADLPVLYTDDYSEITQAYLEDVYEDYSSRTFDFSRLYAPHYVAELTAAMNELDDPAFALLLSDERSSKERADGMSGSWPARDFLGRLSRYDSPYKSDLQSGNLIPSDDQCRRNWQAVNGARVIFGEGGDIVVEHDGDSEEVGAVLTLPAAKYVTYRVVGEIQALDNTSCLPQLELLSPQTKGRITRHAVGAETGSTEQVTKVNFTFTSAKHGTSVQFRPGRCARLSLRIDPVVDECLHQHRLTEGRYDIDRGCPMQCTPAL